MGATCSGVASTSGRGGAAAAMPRWARSWRAASGAGAGLGGWGPGGGGVRGTPGGAPSPAAGGLGDAPVGGDRRPAGGADIGGDLVGGAGIVAAAVDVDAGV